MGYEEFAKITVTRQIELGGKNKYLINGHNAQVNRVQVRGATRLFFHFRFCFCFCSRCTSFFAQHLLASLQNLFHSVQLNVNNPHFLIMQGRITKVLNMKPVEILGMIEEAAGTRMFETKKAIALKTIEKKQVKVDEIKKVLAEEKIGRAHV